MQVRVDMYRYAGECVTCDIMQCVVVLFHVVCMSCHVFVLFVYVHVLARVLCVGIHVGVYGCTHLSVDVCMYAGHACVFVAVFVSCWLFVRFVCGHGRMYVGWAYARWQVWTQGALMFECMRAWGCVRT